MLSPYSLETKKENYIKIGINKLAPNLMPKKTMFIKEI